jgi:hypothetical protein
MTGRADDRKGATLVEASAPLAIPVPGVGISPAAR